MFFDARQTLLAERRRQLLARSALLRVRLATDAQVLHGPLAVADRLHQGWRWLKAHPLEVAAGVALLVAWRPRRVAWLAGRLWAGWRLWRRLHRWREQLTPWLPPLSGPIARAPATDTVQGLGSAPPAWPAGADRAGTSAAPGRPRPS